MVKKISFLLLSAAILVSGYFACRKLNYWERSVRIFTIGNSDQFFEGRTGRDYGRFEGRRSFEERDRSGRSESTRDGFQRPDMRNLPDSIRASFEEGGRRPGMRGRNVPDSLRIRFEREGVRPATNEGNSPDSLRRQNRRQDGGQMGRIPFERGPGNRDGRGRGEFRGGKKINLRNVLWFLAVFGAFTVIVIYLDKAYYIIKRKNSKVNSQNTDQLLRSRL